jgi:hypothetical protein
MKEPLKGFINMNHYINELENELGLSIEDKLDLPLENTDITVHFRNLDKKLIEYISDADGVLGAVAWLNHEAILKELAKKEVVSIVVQKEDPRKEPKISHAESTKRLYKKLPEFKWQVCLEGIPMKLTIDENSKKWDAIRCIGQCFNNNDKGYAKMHNKFLIFGNIDYIYETDIDENLMKQGYPESWSEVDVPIPILSPYAVWTGSFNMTNNALNSLENALYITNKKIVFAYYEEWCKIFTFSETFNWKSEPLDFQGKGIKRELKIEE